MANNSFAIAQLRHLYQQMIEGKVKDTAQAAKGLLGPAIQMLERAESQAVSNNLALATDRDDAVAKNIDQLVAMPRPGKLDKKD